MICCKGNLSRDCNKARSVNHLLEADFWPAWVNFRIAHYSSNRRILSGIRYSDYITMRWFCFPSA
jgi:hypothetical protein